MKVTQHRFTTEVLESKTPWTYLDGSPVHAIPVARATIDGETTIATFWRPSAEELNALNAGGLIVVHVSGETMPPISVEVEQ